MKFLCRKLADFKCLRQFCLAGLLLCQPALVRFPLASGETQSRAERLLRIRTLESSQLDQRGQACVSTYQQELYFYKVRIQYNPQKAKEMGFSNPVTLKGELIEPKWYLDLEFDYDNYRFYADFFSDKYTTPTETYDPSIKLNIHHSKTSRIWHDENSLWSDRGVDELREDEYNDFFWRGYIQDTEGYSFNREERDYSDIKTTLFMPRGLTTKNYQFEDRYELKEEFDKTLVIVSPFAPEHFKLKLKLLRTYPLAPLADFTMEQLHTGGELQAPLYDLPFFSASISHHKPAVLKKQVTHQCPMLSTSQKIAEFYECPDFATFTSWEIKRLFLFAMKSQSDRYRGYRYQSDYEVFDLLRSIDSNDSRVKYLFYCLKYSDYWETNNRFESKSTYGGLVYKCSKFSKLEEPLVAAITDILLDLSRDYIGRENTHELSLFSPRSNSCFVPDP